MAIKRAALPQFIFPCNCLLLQHSLCSGPPPIGFQLFAQIFISICPSVCVFPPPSATFLLSQSKCPFFSSLSQHFAPSEPIYRQSLMYDRHSHQSWFCFTAESGRLSFWLHINCTVRTQTRIVKYLPISPLFFSSTFLSSSFTSLSITLACHY